MDSTLEHPPHRLRTGRPGPRDGTSRWKRAAIVVLMPLLLAMSACGNLEMGVQIRSADDVVITTDFSVKASETAGLVSTDDLCDALKPQGGSTPELETSPYERDGTIGCRLTATTTLDQLAAGGMAVRNGNKVTIRFDTSSVASPSVSTDSLDAMKLSVTFPGKVISHTGNATVSGRTVTWTDPAELADGDGPSATGTLAEGLLGLAWWIWAVVIGAAALIGATVAVVAARRRRSRAAVRDAEAEQWAAGYGPSGQFGYGQQPPPGYGAGPYTGGQYPAPYPQDSYTRQAFTQQSYPQPTPTRSDPDLPWRPPEQAPEQPSWSAPGQGRSSQPWGRPQAAPGQAAGAGTGPDDVTRPLGRRDGRTGPPGDGRSPWQAPGREDPGGRGRSPEQ